MEKENVALEEATVSVVNALQEAVEKEMFEYKMAKDDDERRLHEARIKDLAKSINELRGTKLGSDELFVELEKLRVTSVENKKNRVFDGIKTAVVAGLGLFGTLLGIKASRDNMKVLSEYEKEHYVATTGEKRALESAIDVTGTVRKIESSFKK
ncbi:MAG: hypothetical protein J6U54_01595 [Clostridiales bacterium]|nr:hypothetical protein [Clostridiales bacterium]